MVDNICCSFELEPMTLSQGQLNQAREVASGAVQKLEASENSALFNEGITHPTEEVKQMIAENGDQVDCRGREKGEVIDKKACQCSCKTATKINIREPLSAPF